MVEGNDLYTTLNEILELEIFGTYRYFKESIEETEVLNAGGLLTSISPETNLSLHTGTVGAELKIADALSVGVAGLYSQGSMQYENGVYDADISSQGYSGYFTGFFEDLIAKHDAYIGVLYAESKGDFSTDRYAVDSSALVATGATDFEFDKLEIDAGIVFNHGNFFHGPIAQYTRSSSEMNGFIENSEFGNSVPAISLESEKIRAGYQVSYNFNGHAGVLRPHFSLEYERELEEQAHNIGTILLPEAPEESYIIGAGLAYNPGAGAYGAIDAEYRLYNGLDVSSFSISCSCGSLILITTLN